MQGSHEDRQFSGLLPEPTMIGAALVDGYQVSVTADGTLVHADGVDILWAVAQLTPDEVTSVLDHIIELTDN